MTDRVPWRTPREAGPPPAQPRGDRRSAVIRLALQSEWAGPTPNMWQGANLGPRYIVVHTTQGLMPGTLSWMLNPSANAGCHYLVTADGRIIQLASETDAPWHAGIVCNPSTPVYDGTNPNLVSIGIELEGFAASMLSDVQLATTAALIRDIRARRGFLPTVMHKELAPWGCPDVRSDPGDVNYARLLAILAIEGDNDMTPEQDARLTRVEQKLDELFGKTDAGFFNLWSVWLRRVAYNLDPATGKAKTTTPPGNILGAKALRAMGPAAADKIKGLAKAVKAKAKPKAKRRR